MQAAREFGLVYGPIAQSIRVVFAWIFVAEPTVVHYKQFASHGSDITHHLVHALFVDVEIDAFPTVQQNFAGSVPVGEFMQACPLMEFPAASAHPFVAVGQCQCGGAEHFFFFQIVPGVFFVDAGEEMVPVVFLRVNTQFVVAAVAKCCTDDASRVLLRFAVEREHHFCMCRLGVAYPVRVFDDFHTRLQRFLAELSFVCPGTGKMCQPDIATADRQVGGSKLLKLDRLLLFVTDFSPCLDDIRILPCFVADVDEERIHFVFQFYHRQNGIFFCKACFFYAYDCHLKCQVAVGMADG